MKGDETTGPRERYAFLDALRLVAACQMIVGHTLDALLADDFRTGPRFALWTFVRGLTSVTFFCAAGLSFVLSSRSGDRARGRRRRLARAAELLVLGYALRAPLGLLLGERLEPALRKASAVDVLQCMAVGIALCELVSAWGKRPAARALIAGIAAVACFALAAPLAGGSACSPVSVYWDAACGSPFPLFPWLGYPLCALAVGELALSEAVGRAPGPRQVALRIALASAAALALWRLAHPWYAGVPAQLSPAFALLKLGLVLALTAALAVSVQRLPALLTKLASETLFLYATHIVVLYAGHVGLRDLVGHSLPPWAALAAALALTALTGVCAVRYGRFVPALRRGKAGGTPRPERRPPHPG